MKKIFLSLAFSLLLTSQLEAARSCISIFDLPPEVPKTKAQIRFEGLNKPADDSVEKILADYAEGKQEPSWIENELNFARFIRQATLLTSKEHPIDMYGEENYKAFRAADEYLLSIKKGEFSLKDNVLQQTHLIASEGVVSILKHSGLGKFIPDGYLPDQAGVFKKRNSIGRDPLFFPITDKAVEALRANKWLGDMGGQHGFFELPFLSSPNKRRGFIIYENPKKNLRNQIDAFYREMNQKLDLAKRKKYDPVLLASEIQLALVSLHPFVDGNGRTSRLIMDRVLHELDLPPSLIADTSNDLYMTPPEWAKEIQTGLRTYVELQKTIYPSGAPRINENYDAPEQDFIPQDILRTSFEYRGLKFTFSADGFIYDSKGIPHAYYNKTLYPIADNTYLLYLMSNKNNQFSNASKDIFKANFEFYKRAKRNVRDMNVLPYSTINIANKEAKIHMYDWQKGLLQDLFTINATDPNQVLGLFGSLQHNFSTYSAKAPASILAEYEMLDHKLWTIKQNLDENFAAEIQVIEKARETVFNAAKTLISKSLGDMQQALGADYEFFSTKEVSFKIFQMIYKKSKLSKSSYTEAMRSTNDGKIYLLRSDSVFVEKIGFMSQMNFKNLLKSLPMYKKLKIHLLALNEFLNGADQTKRDALIAKWKEYSERIKAGDTAAFKLFNLFLVSIVPEKYRTQLDPENIETTFSSLSQVYYSFVRTILRSKYEGRGILDQYDRAFVDNYLQMEGWSPEKPGKSFSSNSGLYMSSYGGSSIPFASSSFDSGVYLVEIDRKDISWNDYSVFSNFEYEFVIKKRLPSRKIIDKIRINDFKQKVFVDSDKYRRLKLAVNPYSFGGSLQVEGTTETDYSDYDESFEGTYEEDLSN